DGRPGAAFGDPRRDRLGTRHRRSAHRCARRQRIALARTRDGSCHALPAPAELRRTRLRARALRGTDREVRGQGARARAGGQGLHLDRAGSERGAMIEVAEQNLHLASFAELERARDGRDPVWLRELRRRAIDRFAELGFPTTRHEDWQYTSVAPVAQTPFRLAPHETVATPERLAELSFFEMECTEFVFVNGRHSMALSTVGVLPQGVHVE